MDAEQKKQALKALEDALNEKIRQRCEILTEEQALRQAISIIINMDPAA